MPSGAPDFGRAAASAEVHLVSDLAEQAARVGFINTYHRGGQLFWQDDFETANNNKWAFVIGGTGAAVAISTAQMRNGAQSVLLTAGSTSQNLAQIRRGLGAPGGVKVGIEMSFQLPQPTDNIHINSVLRDGTNSHTWQVTMDVANNRLEARDSAGVDQIVLDPLDLVEEEEHFHTCKLVLNIATDAYVRFFLDNRSIDLSAHSAQVASDSSPRIWDVSIRNTGRLTVNDLVYVDDMIVTLNEP